MARSQSAARGAPPKIDRKRISLLHVAKAKLGMTDEEYRGMLGSFGVESSVDLDVRQFSAVMTRLKAAGFEGNTPQKTPLKGGRARPGSTISSVETQKRRMNYKLDAVLAELGKTRAYADGMARQMFGVEKVDWLEVGQLYKVVQALMGYRKRKTT